MSNHEDIVVFLRQYLPLARGAHLSAIAANGQEDVATVLAVRTSLALTLGFEAGKHYDERWLVSTILGGLQELAEADPDDRVARVSAAETGSQGASTSGAAPSGEASASSMAAPSPTASLPGGPKTPIPDKNGADITTVELAIPIGCEQGDFFSFKMHPAAKVRSIAEVPTLAKAGDKISYAHAVWLTKLGPPQPCDATKMPVPRHRHLDLLLDGFEGLSIP